MSASQATSNEVGLSYMFPTRRGVPPFRCRGTFVLCRVAKCRLEECSSFLCKRVPYYRGTLPLSSHLVHFAPRCLLVQAASTGRLSHLCPELYSLLSVVVDRCRL